MISFTYSNPIFWADFLIGIVILVVFLVTLTVIAHIWLRVPYVPTPISVIREMVRFADLRGNETVYDLGAGDGRALIEMKRRHPQIRAIGYELVPTVWLLGRFRIWISRKKIEFYCANAMAQNLSDADCIFLYLMPSLLAKLEKKFNSELRPGTKVLSYTFVFPDRAPTAVRRVEKTGKKLFLYEW